MAESGVFVLDPKIKSRLKSQVSFPSPPGVAQQIIMLANDPDVQITAVAEVIALDPGLAAKILRIANSALYARRRRSDNLRQALTVLGLSAATALALSFSIAPLFRKDKTQGLDYARCWRRALLGAVASRTIGEYLDIRRTEDLFLAGLMQDIAMLALDKTTADFYANLPVDATHVGISRYEVERVGVDHAEIGGWLLREWNLPDFLCESIALSHTAETADASQETGKLSRCIGLASAVADFFQSEQRETTLPGLEASAQTLLGLDRNQFGEIISRIIGLLPEVERLFDTKVLDAAETLQLMDQARELLTQRSLESIEKVSHLESRADELEKRTAILQDQNRHDASPAPLTGAIWRPCWPTNSTAPPNASGP